MELGMPTLIEASDLNECINLAQQLAFRFIEINMNMPQYQIESMPVAEMERCISSRKLYFTVHLDENLNVCDFNKDVADAYMHTVLSAIALSKRLAIPILNMHMSNGVYFTLPSQKVYLFEKYNSKYMEKIRNFRDQCEQAIGAESIKICIENCDGYPDFAKDAITYLLESEVFGLTLDIGHSHSACGADEAFILKNIHKLAHMHIHDAKGTQNHLAAGDGEIAITDKLRLAKERHCRCVLETKTVAGLILSANRIKEYLEEIQMNSSFGGLL